MSTQKQTYALNDQTRQQIFDCLASELAKEPAFEFAYVYGSSLEADAVHDIDIGIYLRESHLKERSNLQLELAERLSKAVGFPIDVRVVNDAPLTFLFHVMRGRLLLSRNEKLLTDLLEDVARRYLDIAPLLRESTKDAFAA